MPVVGPALRVLVPLAGHEPLRVRRVGELGGGEAALRVTWNDTPLLTRAARGELRFEVPEALTLTRVRTNVLVIDGLRPGSKLARLEFESFTRWGER